jgi:hypothetical protein
MHLSKQLILDLESHLRQTAVTMPLMTNHCE